MGSPPSFVDLTDPLGLEQQKTSTADQSSSTQSSSPRPPVVGRKNGRTRSSSSPSMRDVTTLHHISRYSPYPSALVRHVVLQIKYIPDHSPQSPTRSLSPVSSSSDFESSPLSPVSAGMFSDMDLLLTTSYSHSHFLLDLVCGRCAIKPYMPLPMVPPAIWLPIRRSPPMSAVKHRIHRRRRQLFHLTVVTNRRRHQQQCLSPYPVFPTSSPIRQKPSRIHLRLTLTLRIICRPPSLKWNVTLKATMEIVAGLLASGYRSHLILTTFANVLLTCDPIQFYKPRFVRLFCWQFFFVVLFTPFFICSNLCTNKAQSEIHHNI